MIETTDDGLLGRRLRYRQPRDGFRSGIEPVLLAASVPARNAQRVLEGGAGTGAALLCLAARVPGICGVGVEVQPDLAAVATRNAAENGLAQLTFIAADLLALPALAPFDHAIANPPYHPGDAPSSPRPERDRAKRETLGMIEAWIGALGAALRHRGTLTLVLPAGLVPRALDALGRTGCGSPAMLPLWPRAGTAAKLCLFRGIKGGRAPFRVHSGLALHAADGGFTPKARAVLQDGAAIEL